VSDVRFAGLGHVTGAVRQARRDRDRWDWLTASLLVGRKYRVFVHREYRDSLALTPAYDAVIKGAVAFVPSTSGNWRTGAGS
jgi:hypothetical protein